MVTQTSYATASDVFNYSVTINETFDLSNPSLVSIWKKDIDGTAPNGFPATTEFYLTCLSDKNPDYGACPVYPKWASRGGTYVSLSFSEKRSGMKHTVTIEGTEIGPCSAAKFASTAAGCDWGPTRYNVYISAEELKKFPVGGIWMAHLKMRTGEWHAGKGALGGWPGFMGTYWTADITLHITDNNNIRIWLPQFHGSTANVVMPVMPAYWALNKPGLVSAEKVVETCLYDGYNSNSQRFEVTLNSNYTDSTTQDFLLQNTSEPTSKPLHYQVLASPPGQSGAMQRLNPGVTQTYTGINSTGIRQVIMPGLQTPVACVPWPIRIKLLPFDLSRQAAGHYNGTFSITFTPSLY